MSTEVNYALKQALKLYDDSIERFAEYSKFYMLTTENLNGYYPYFDFKDKTVLTVTSSFDHALNAILYGAKKVITFDVNKLAYYMANLKLAAVKVLTYDEFIEFFFRDNAFSYEIFKKICLELNKDVISFFEGIYKHFEYNGYAIKDSYLFHHGHKNNIDDNTYLLDNNYDRLKEKVKDLEVEFINASLLNLTKCLKNQKYDLILLSNISDYAKNMFGKNYLKEFFDFIKNDISRLLNKNGQIAAAYIYDYGVDGDVRSDINIDSKRKEAITEEYEIVTFKSTIKKLNEDAIIVYKGGDYNGK